MQKSKRFHKATYPQRLQPAPVLKAGMSQNEIKGYKRSDISKSGMLEKNILMKFDMYIKYKYNGITKIQKDYNYVTNFCHT